MTEGIVLPVTFPSFEAREAAPLTPVDLGLEGWGFVAHLQMQTPPELVMSVTAGLAPGNIPGDLTVVHSPERDVLSVHANGTDMTLRPGQVVVALGLDHTYLVGHTPLPQTP